jgi:hypothetical protein
MVRSPIWRAAAIGGLALLIPLGARVLVRSGSLYRMESKLFDWLLDER